jgi:hypothetical protein
MLKIKINSGFTKNAVLKTLLQTAFANIHYLLCSQIYVRIYFEHELKKKKKISMNYNETVLLHVCSCLTEHI